MFRRAGAALLAALTIAAAGCAGEETRSATGRAETPRSASAVASGPPWYDDVAPAEPGITVGGRGTPCELPISFALPARWVARPVDRASGMTLGGSRLRCEVDAKPAGNVGFLRIWAVDEAAGDLHAALEDFLAAHGRLREIEYRRVRRGPLELVEATYLQENELSGGPNRQRALMADTASGPILLTLAGMDTSEFEAMFPAYQLATRTLRITG